MSSTIVVVLLAPGFAPRSGRRPALTGDFASGPSTPVSGRRYQDMALDLDGRTSTTAGTSIALCIPTYRRPVELDILLERIAKLDLGDRIEMSVFVVDNDPERSADEVIERHRGLGVLKLISSHEPVPGYVAVRNHIHGLVPPDVEWIASIDDDDIPESNDWLLELLRVAETHDADMVCGPKIPATGPGIDRAMLERGSVRFADDRDGAPMAYGWTGNLLIRHAIVPKDPFDERFSLIGAEDADLTMRLVDRGHRLVYAPGAVVTAFKSADQLSVDRTATILHSGSGALAMAYLVNHGRLPFGRIVRSTIRYVESTLDRAVSTFMGQQDRADRARLRQAGAAGLLTAGVLRRPVTQRVGLNKAELLPDLESPSRHD